MISKEREKWWNYKRYDKSNKERYAILYELEKQLGSGANTTRIINTLKRFDVHDCMYRGKGIETIDDLKDIVARLRAYKWGIGISNNTIELLQLFIDMYEAA